MSVKLLHEELIERGYNVIPVNAKKEPLAPQYKDCYDKPCRELAGLFEERHVKRQQAGIALLGRINPYFPVRVLVIIDVDDPAKFPPEARELLKGTWHWLTGPRCPRDGDKHDIICGPVACRHGDHDFDLSEAVRGEAYAVLVPREVEELIEAGVAKLAGGAVEIRIRGYQLIPPSIHPSGITYEWVTPPWAGGGFEHPKELTLEEFRRLVDALGGAGPRPQPKEAAAEGCRTFRELSDEDAAKIIEIIKPWYVKDHRNHILVALLGILRRACYSNESIAKFYDALESWAMSVYDDVDKKKDDYILRGVLEGRDWRLYGWPGLRNELMQVAQKTGRSAEDVEEAVRQLKRIILKSVVKMRLCLGREMTENGPVCIKYLRAKIIHDIMLVEVVYVAKNKKPRSYDIARLPANMAVVRDPYYAEEYYVAYSGDGKLIAVAPANEWDDFLRVVSQLSSYSIVNKSKVVDGIKHMLPRVVRTLSAGLTDDSINDPEGVLDKNDYGVEPLVNVYRWIINSYSARNAKLAWFNVMAAFAKLFTPLIRIRKKTFIDYIIYNVGRGGEGKTTLARYILTPLLGGEDANDAYDVRFDGPVRTEPQMRNLLALNRLPLILDEQVKKALISNSGILLSAAVGLGTTGVQAARHGYGIAVKFKNLRGVIVFTNVPFSTFVRAAASESSDYAMLRRFIELAWDFEPMKPASSNNIPEAKPVYGYAVRLWRKYGSELMQSADLLDLIERLADVMTREHAGDAAVAEMAEYTKQVVAELRELKTMERQSLRDEQTIVDRAYQYVAEDLKVSQLSAVKVLRYIFENASRAGIAFTVPKSADLRALTDDVYDAAARIKSMYTTAASQAQDRLSEDAAVVVNMLDRLAQEKRVAVVVLAKTPLVPGAPRTLAGIQKNVYVVGGVKRYGYAVPLAKFVNMFLDSERAEEDAQDEIGE
jgi:hypothetical protein